MSGGEPWSPPPLFRRKGAESHAPCSASSSHRRSEDWEALAEAPGHRLIAVHCKETQSGRGGGWPVLADEDEIQDKIRRQVAEADDEPLDVSLRIITAAAPGAPHKIADLARELDAHAIVVGTRGHSPAAGVLLGSLTQRLLHIAPSPGGRSPAIGPRRGRASRPGDRNRDALNGSSAAAHCATAALVPQRHPERSTTSAKR